MLDFARPIRFEFESVSMTELLDSCIEVIETKIMEKGIIINKTFPKKVPRVMIDSEKIEQVIINLLLNSIEAIHDMGHIGITVKPQKGRQRAVIIEISDNGHGINNDDLPYVFDPFFSKKAKGTGLGLANAKKIIEAHGGSIQAIPVNPHGVCMRFTLPIANNGVHE
jgi:signal transduction histidine kinase